MVEESVGWRCLNCDKTYQNCVPTYMLSAKMADVSEATFINFYRHEGTAIMGLPADKLKDIRDQGDIQVINDTFLDRQYRKFGLILKPKVEARMYRNNDGDFHNKGPSHSVKLSCVRVMEHSWATENQMLLSRLKLYEPLFEHQPHQRAHNPGARKKLQFTESQHASRLAEFERRDEENRRVKMEQQH